MPYGITHGHGLRVGRSSLLLQQQTNLSTIDEHALVLVELPEDCPQLSGTQSYSEVLHELRAESRRVHLHLQEKCTLQCQNKPRAEIILKDKI